MSRTRTRLALLGVIVAELAIGAALVARHRGRVEPPLPDLSETDPLTAAEFRRLAARCQTAPEWSELGTAYLATGFFPEAEACFRRAAELAPDDPELAFRHAFALERLGLLDEANARYQTAIDRKHTRTGDLRYYIGRNHLRLERAEAAAAVLRGSDGPGARYELALLDARDGRTAAADSTAEQLASEFRNSYPPVSLRYRLALARNDRPAAAALADQFDRRPVPLPTPFDTEVNWVFGAADGFGRAKAFRDAGREAQAGRFAAAEEKLREALAARWEPEVADRLAEVAFVLGRPDEAARVLTEVVERGGPSFEALWRLGQAHDALGRPDQALAAWERAARIASGPRARNLWFDLATRCDQSKQPEKAKPLFARAHVIDGEEALAAGRTDGAVSALRQAVEADPRSARAWFVLGEAHRLAGRADEARGAYDRCLSVDPEYGRAHRSRPLLGGK